MVGSDVSLTRMLAFGLIGGGDDFSGVLLRSVGCH